MKSLGSYLASSNITQGAFAAEIGVKQATVSRLVNGAKPSLTLAAKIEQATGGAVPVTAWLDEATQ